MKQRSALFLTEWYLPVMSGSRVYHHEVAKRLENAVVVTRHERGGEEAFDLTASADGVRIIRGWGIGRRLFSSLPQNPLLAMLAEYLPAAGTMLAWSLSAAIRHRPATIHAAAIGLSSSLSAHVVSAVCRVPYIIYAHGEDIAEHERRNARFKELMKRILGGASAVVCNAQNTAEMVKRFGIAAERVVVAYPGVDTGRFGGLAGRRADGARSGRGLVMLSVGHLIKQKGHEITMRALPRLVAEWPDLRYLIVGDGPEKDRLESLAAELGVGSNVTFLGRVPEAQLLEAYQTADVYVQPSIIVDGITEGYGISYLEAGAAGLPVVGGRCGGVVEAVVEGVTGLLATPGDVDDFARAASSLLRDGDLRRRMGEAGRKLAEERTWDKTLMPVLALDRSLREQSA